MNTPRLRFNEFKDEWKTKDLKQVLKVNSGKDYKHLGVGDIPVYGTGGYMTSVNSSLSEEDAVGIGRKGSIDKPKKLKAPFWTVDTLFYCTPKDNIDLDFLYALFNNINWKKYDESTGVPSLSKTTIENIIKFIPSTIEQIKIGKFFKKIDSIIQLQQEKVDLLKEQKKGYMQKIFNQELRFKDANGEIFPEWEEKLVSDILKLNLREVDKPTNAYMRLGLRSHARGTFHELVTNVESVSMDKLYVVQEGDFIINITFAWEQALAVADKTDHGKLVSHRFPTYLFKENHHKDFYKYFFTTKYFKYCLGNASPGGAGRNRVLNKADFMNIQVNIPTYDEQVKISSFLSDLDKKLLLEEQKLELLQQKKQAFMQQMFI